MNGDHVDDQPDRTDITTDAIQVRGLTKAFGDLTAVDDLDFEIPSGRIFGLLGPNGAGKTTTINMLTGLARPDKGEIRIAGLDCTARPRAAQHLVGVVPDESNLYPELTGFENLCFCAALYGLKKKDRQAGAHDLLEAFGLAKAANRKFAGYSKGMKRKLTIAAGIIHSPAILFLDEPTTGIDVASARQVRKLVADLNEQGTTILLTTHYIEEAERLCHRVAFIVSGRIVREDSVDNLVSTVKDRHVVQISMDTSAESRPDSLVADLASSFPAFEFSLSGPGTIRVEAAEPIGVGPLIRLLEDRGALVLEARRLRPSLEDVFVAVTGLEAGTLAGEKEKSGGKKA